MLQQVGKARLKRLEVLLVELVFRHAAMVLERADRGHHDHGVGLQARQAALDVEELLRAQIGAEASLGDGVVAERQGHLRRHDGVAAVRDVGEGAAVDERGRALERLHEVRLERVLEQRSHGAFGMQIVSGDGLVVEGVAHHDAAEALLQVGNAGRQAENSHDLGRHGDVEAVLAGHTVGFAAEAVDDVAQLPVVHVDHALPGDFAHIDAELVAVVNVRVEHSRKQIVRSTDGVEVAREVQVNIFHGNDLSISAACSATLDTEHGSQARFAQSDHHVLAALRKRIGQADRRGGLALARRRGVDRRHEHELARRMLVLAQKVVVDLRLVLAVHLEILVVDTRPLGDRVDALRLRSLCDFDITLHVDPSLQVSLSRLGAFSIHKPQPNERQVRLDGGDGTRVLGNERREPTRRNDRSVVSKLLDHAAHESVSAIGLAVDDARLQGLLGVAPDGMARVDQIDRSQACSMGKQRCRTCLDARRDDAARKAPLLVDHLDVGCRAEVDDDDRRAEQLARRDGVGHAVRADFTRIGVVRIEKRTRRLRRAHDGAHARQILHRTRPRARELGNHRRERRTRDVARPKILGLEKRQELHAQLVGGMVAVGGDAPHAVEVFPLVDADGRLGVPHVDDK